jgi:hypothetical protein
VRKPEHSGIDEGPPGRVDERPLEAAHGVAVAVAGDVDGDGEPCVFG